MTTRLGTHTAVETLPLETAPAPVTKPVEEVLDEIRSDSQRSAQAYLDEVVVPHGGE